MFNYNEVEQFALLCCKFKHIGRGDEFATDTEMAYIKEDVWSWPELWYPEFAEIVGCSPAISSIDVDHFKKTFKVTE